MGFLLGCELVKFVGRTGYSLGARLFYPFKGTAQYRPVMPKRILRVVKWLSTTPAVALCTACAREFKVPVSTLTRTTDAQANLQKQFDRHRCEVEGVDHSASSS